MKLAANLSMLYGYLPVADRFAAAAHDGFHYVEILFPYDQSPQWYAQQLQQHDLQLVLINTPIDSSDYPTGMTAQSGAISRFRQGFSAVQAVCAATGCKAVHVMAGGIDTDLSRDEQQAVLVQNLDWTARQCPELILQLEALNDIDVPGYFYSRPKQVLQVLNDCSQPNIGLQFDFYHVVKQGLSLGEQLSATLPWIRHVQVAGSPERAEPALECDGLMAGFKQLYETGYSGYVGCEYRPKGHARDGLAWMRPLLDSGWASMK